MSLHDAQPEEPSLILTLTPEEARYGGIHMLLQPDGRPVMVTVPADTRENDEIRIPAQGTATSTPANTADLVIRIAFNQPDTTNTPVNPAALPESNLLFVEPRLANFPLIIPEMSDSPEFPVLLVDPPGSNASTLLFQAPQSAFSASPATPIPPEAPAALATSSQEHDEVSEFPTTPVPAVVTPMTELPTTPVPAVLPPQAEPTAEDAPILASAAPAEFIPFMPIPPIEAAIQINGEALPPDNVTPGSPLENADQQNPTAEPPDVPAVSPGGTDASNPLALPVWPNGATIPAPGQLPPLTPPRRKRLDTMAILSLCAALLLLLLSIGVAVFSFGYYQPAQAQARTDATANAIPTATLHAMQTQSAVVAKTAIAQQQATVITRRNLYTQSTSTRPFLSDSLSHQTNSAWDEIQYTDNSSCAFKHGNYEISEPSVGYFMPCFAENSFFTNFAVQVDLNIHSGGDGGGIAFRGDGQYGDGYYFRIDQMGYYLLYKYTTKSATIMSGQTYSYKVDQTNQLTIIVMGTTFYFYLNQQFLDSATDRTFGEGQVGLMAGNYQDPTIVDFHNFKVWLLP